MQKKQSLIVVIATIMMFLVFYKSSPENESTVLENKKEEEVKQEVNVVVGTKEEKDTPITQKPTEKPQRKKTAYARVVQKPEYSQLQQQMAEEVQNLNELEFGGPTSGHLTIRQQSDMMNIINIARITP